MDATIRSRNAALLFICAALAITAGYLVRDLLLPLVVAIFFAILFQPITHTVKKLRLPSWIGLIIVVALTGGAIWGIASIVAVGVDAVNAKAPEYSAKIQRMVLEAQHYIQNMPGGTELLNPANFSINQDTIIKTASQVLGSVVGIVGDTILVLIYLIFMLVSSVKFNEKMGAALDRANAAHLKKVATEVNAKVLKYLRVKTFFNVINAGITYGVLIYFNIDFAPLFALLTFFITYLPNIGSVVGVVLPGIVSLIQYEDPALTLIAVGVLAVLQSLVGNVLEPRAMGQSFDLSPVVVLFSLVFWGWMWGVVGMILSVPIMAIVKATMEQFETTAPLAILMGNRKPVPEPMKAGV